MHHQIRRVEEQEIKSGLDVLIAMSSDIMLQTVGSPDELRSKDKR